MGVEKTKGQSGSPGLEEPGSEHRGACGAHGGVLAHPLSFLRTQDVGSQLPLSDDMIWVLADMPDLRRPSGSSPDPSAEDGGFCLSLCLLLLLSLFFPPGTPSFTQHVGTYWVGWQGSWSGSSLGKRLPD